MKEGYKELREDVLDEEKAIEETLERLYEVRTKFDPEMKDYLYRTSNGNLFNEFL